MRTVIGTEPPAAPSQALDRDETIRRRAYDLYIERGQEPGYETDDWLQAEREFEGGVV